jgi:hypothetical protein
MAEPQFAGKITLKTTNWARKNVTHPASEVWSRTIGGGKNKNGQYGYASLAEDQTKKFQWRKLLEW